MRFIIFAFCVLLLSCSQAPPALIDVENSDLTVGEPRSADLEKMEADTFRITLKGNTFVKGFANQITADVVIEVLNPEKKPTNDYDDSARGNDYFFFLAKEPGEYFLVVKPFQDDVGTYEIQLTGVVPLAAEPEARVDQIANAMISGDGPGASIAVVKDNKMVYSKGFGLANLEYGIKNTPQTIFHIASVSKQFTGFAIAMLAEQGKVSMSDDVRKYIPELHDFGTPVMLDHLVHHTSGLRDQWNLLAMAGWRLDDVITREQIMRLISRQTDLNFKPGDEMVYCNTGFTLLAEVVSRVTGKSFAEWTAENIFEPLEMDNTLFYDDHEKIVVDRAYSYYQNDTTYKKSVLSYANVGATSLFTTVEDLSKWAINFETMKVGNARVMEMMEQRFVLNNGDTMSYGYGMGVDKYKGLKRVQHGGSDAGYRTHLLRFPDQDFAVSVFSNVASFSAGGMSHVIADAYLEDLYEPEVKKEEEQAPTDEEKKEEFDASKVKLQDYVGRFYSEELQTFYDLDIQTDTIRVHHQRHDDFKMWPVGDDQFRTDVWWMGDISFTRNAVRKVTGLKASSGRVRNVVFNKQ